MVTALAVVGGVFALIMPEFMAQLPALTDSLTSAVNRLNTLLQRLPVGQAGTTAADLFQQAARGTFGGIGTALQTGLNVLVGLVLLIVVLACYLTSGRRIVNTGLGLVPDRRRPAAQELADRVWHTLGSYTRALFLVALFDATSVGLGLWLLGVPLVLPLSVLVFFGAFIPYIGAFVSGLLAVLVAFADGGLGTALAVLALIIVVQQIEGNVVQPLLMGKVTRVSAFTVIVAVSIGATLLGTGRATGGADSGLHSAGDHLCARAGAASGLGPRAGTTASLRQGALLSPDSRCQGLVRRRHAVTFTWQPDPRHSGEPAGELRRWKRPADARNEHRRR